VTEEALRVALQHLRVQHITPPNATHLDPVFKFVKPSGMPALNSTNWERLGMVSRNARTQARFAVTSYRLVGAVRFISAQRTGRNKANERAALLGFLEQGANPNIWIGEYADTPLHFACVSDANTHIIQLLLVHGANPNVVNTAGDTPMTIATFHKATRVIALLKKYGAH
jgi:hypothetical protein